MAKDFMTSTLNQLKVSDIKESEFDLFLNWTTVEEAKQRSNALQINYEDMLKMAQKEIHQILLNGLQTPNHFFKKLENSNSNIVGYLWFAVRTQINKKRIFIYDIQIFPEYRNQGYGRFLLDWLSQETKNLGYQEIGLHVLAENKIARLLYEKSGFEMTNIYYSKKV